MRRWTTPPLTALKFNDSARLHGASKYVDVSLYSVVMSVPAALRALSTQTGRNSVTSWGKGHHGRAERDQLARVVEVVTANFLTTSFEEILDSLAAFSSKISGSGHLPNPGLSTSVPAGEDSTLVRCRKFAAKIEQLGQGRTPLASACPLRQPSGR
jgi:hypothetical protein